jgi:TQXA domain-containing protein/LPXTG-motif cell wall-anchored protein
MYRAQRQRGRRRASAAVASLAIAVGLVGALATAASAASQAELIGPTEGHTAEVEGTIGGDTDTESFDAGLFDLLIDGDVEARGYCIDIHTGIANGTELDEIEWNEASVPNLDKVEAILRWYHPNGDGPDGAKITGSDAQKAAATQAAIWHYTDDFNLDDDDAVIQANYDTILAAVEGGLEGFGEPTVDVSITPPASTEGETGGLVGPYVINTSGSSVTLTTSDGVTVHNEDGSPFTGTVTDGTQVWLSSEAERTGTLTATASADAIAGRVFFKKGSQKLIMASTVGTGASAEAPVSFTTPTPTTASTTTSTTVVDTTTTTAPDTPDTTPGTEAPTTTVTVPTGNGGGLPVTGAQSLVLVAIAALLLAAGAAFGVISRRKRLEGEG